MVTPSSDPASPDRSQPDYLFDFSGGQLAMDFANTVGNRGAEPQDHLNTFGDIVAWAEGRGIIDRTEAAGLRREAAAAPDKARRAWREARELREAVYNVLKAIADERKPKPADLERLNRAVAETYRHAALSPAGGRRFVLETAAGAGLARIIAPVVRAAVDLLTSAQVQQIGRCVDDSCAWLFLDTTRSHTRRWCDMKSCGNRNKVRRFRRAR